MAINKVSVFDFDGTLFESPLDTPDNRKKYEKATGLPWLIDKEMSRELTKKHKKFIPMRRGWWGKAATLEPPLVPIPAPSEWFKKEVVEAFHASKKNENDITLIMTGRHVGLKAQVCRILHEGKLVNFEVKNSKEGKTFYHCADDQVALYFLGDDGPRPKGNKPSETFPWKCWVLEQYLDVYPEIEAVEIWEDREEHVEKFKNLQKPEKVIVNHVV